MKERAITELEKAAQLSRDQQLRVSSVISRLGYGYGVTGRRRQAEAILEELTQMSKTKYIPPANFANVYIGLGDKDRALFLAPQGI